MHSAGSKTRYRTALLGLGGNAVADVQHLERRRAWGAGALFAAVSVFAALLLFARPGLGLPFAVFVGAVVLLACMSVWLWRSPTRCVFVLFGGAVAITSYPNAGAAPPIYLGMVLPFFSDLNTIFHVKLIALSPADLFLIGSLVVWLVHHATSTDRRLNLGAIPLPLLLYMSVVVFASMRGYLIAHNFTQTLWELRIQVYLLAAYVLTCNLVKTRSQVQTLLWILIIGTGEIGIEGTLLYIFKVRNMSVGFNELYSHEQAFFFNAFLTLGAILFLYGGSAKMKRAVLLLLPFVLVADFANDRRAGILALAVALLALLLVTIATNARLRKSAALIIVLLAVMAPPYYLAFKNHPGTLGMPARAFASATSSSTRDASSDASRVGEDQDIFAAIRSHAFVGNGFGVRMPYSVYSLSDIEKLYPLEPYLPHNSVLWVWMSMGIAGFVLFWFVIGSTLVRALGVLRQSRDSWVQGMALFVVLMVIQEVIFGYLDMQWTIARNLLAVGVLMGLVSVLRRFCADEAPRRRWMGGSRAVHFPARVRRGSEFATLTVRNGRVISEKL